MKKMLSLALIALVVGQNALDGRTQGGGGTALHGPLQTGATVNGARQQEDYRSRNLVVTGDVAGGKGFRGTVGYTSAEDFRGTTSGDTTQSFRANSANSSASALSSLAMNDRFSFATGIGIVAYQRDFATSNSSGVSAPATRMGFDSGFAAQQSKTAANDSRLQLDSITRQAGVAAGYSANYQPTTIQITRSTDSRTARIIANPFVGIVAVPNDDLIESLDHGIYGSALMRADLRSGRSSGQRILRSYLSGITADAATPQAISATAMLDLKTKPQPAGANPPAATGDSKAPAARRVLEIRTPYDRVVTSVATRYQNAQGNAAADPNGVDPAELAQTNAILQDFRLSFRKRSSDQILGTDRISRGLGGAAQTARETPPAVTDSSKESTKSTTPNGPQVRPIRALTADEAYLMMAHGQKMSQLDGGTQEALDTLLRIADRAMRGGRFLSAEKSFAASAAIAPSNPLPIAGIANSQVAAGLQLAAAMALRRLFVTWPEMIDTRYDYEMLGGAERLREVAEQSISKSEESKYAADYGLVAAYIGHQLNDAALMQRGIAIMDHSQDDRVMTDVLRGVWSHPAGSAPPVPPAAPVAPAAAPATGEARPSN